MTALDTNVLIYACDKAEPRRQQIALDLIARSRLSILGSRCSLRDLSIAKRFLRCLARDDGCRT
jgi:predicted nucleic acid-binding protein